MTVKAPPLAGLRVLDFGHYVAGPLAGVFLADQGAEVIRIRHPHSPDWDSRTETTLARGKQVIQADLKDPAQRDRVLELATACDVIIENFRPGVMDRLGFGYEQLAVRNPGLIYVSLPGYGRHDPRKRQAAWDGTISAAAGLYTDLAIGGAAADLPPTYTPLLLPSLYAGLWGATAALAALYARQQHGHGDRIEVPLLDAAMSAAAGVIFQVVEQPARYNVPPLPRSLLDRISLRRLPRVLSARAHRLVGAMMPALFRNYVCSDGKQIFLCAIDNANHIAKLVDTLGIRAKVGELGFVFGDVLDVPPTRNNINAFRGTSRSWIRLQKLMAARFATAPADVWAERLALAGVPAVRQRGLGEWLAMPVMQESGVLMQRHDAAGQIRIEPSAQVDLEGAGVSTRTVAASTPAAGTRTGWASDRGFPVPAGSESADARRRRAPLAGVRVLDLANVIAGPSAGRTLAELGADVTHVSAVTPRMGPRMNLLLGLDVNPGKRSLAVDLHRPAGQDIVRRLLPATDVLLYNKLPEQARRLGVAPDQVHALNPETVICAVTAYGGVEPGGWEDRPAYDPVIQALTGIMQRFGGENTPAVHGIASCIDYFTGYSAAFAAVLGLVARSRGAQRLVARTSLVRTGAWVQLPQLCNPTAPQAGGLSALGGACFDRLYATRGGGWIHVDVDPRGVSATVPTDPRRVCAWLTRELGLRRPAEAADWAAGFGLVAQPVISARELRHDARSAGLGPIKITPALDSGRVVRLSHPAGETYFAPENSWLRFDRAERYRLSPAPKPGQDSIEILVQAGYSQDDIDRLIDTGTVATHWPGLRTYLPA